MHRTRNGNGRTNRDHPIGFTVNGHTTIHICLFRQSSRYNRPEDLIILHPQILSNPRRLSLDNSPIEAAVSPDGCSEILKSTLKPSKLEASKRRLFFIEDVITALLDTFQNDPSMVKDLVPVEVWPKTNTYTGINIEKLMDTMKSNIRRILAAEIEK